MAHKIAKLLLEQANNFLQREEAIKSAMRLGMPLAEIEAYLDWLDSVRNAEDSPAAGDMNRDRETRPALDTSDDLPKQRDSGSEASRSAEQRSWERSSANGKRTP